MIIQSEAQKNFVSKARELAGKISSLDWEDVLIVFHADADGTAAAAIACIAFRSMGISFCARSVKQIDKATLENIAYFSKPVIFLDIGSGYLNEIKTILDPSKVVILDHHEPEGERGGILMLNPNEYGLNGSSDISGSGVSYLVFKNLVDDFSRMNELAVVGALADLQDAGPNRSLLGLNSAIILEGEENGSILIEEDFIFFGRETLPIHVSIASSSNFIIPGLTGDENVALNFLTSLGIEVKKDDSWRTFNDLSEAEKSRLLTGLMQYMVDLGLSPDGVQNMFGKIYVFKYEPKGTVLRDGREFSALLNSCARMGFSHIGLAVAIGEKGRLFEEAQRISREYRAVVSKSLSNILSVPGTRVESERVLLYNGEGIVDPRVLSPVASIISTSLPKNLEKILVVTAAEDDMLKVSIRVPKSLAQRGFNGGLLASSAARHVGGLGGGHDVASGAIIPRRRFQSFMEAVEKNAKEQFSKLRNA
ncbi:MAG: DHH family phosphoesterase [Crenarchaeota archaeon]|nr:DHH family phosphoesterase [Thermoproteota archaeon]MDW8033711.1 DHH family phosphoesterase [Nitrososphaerota archaeon]